MSALPPETGLGYTPPVVRQLSVFLENKVGRLHDMLEVFQREPGLELCAISVLEASEHSVVRLIPTNTKLASDLLKEDGWAFTETDLLVVRLQPGQTIEGLCLALLSVELNLRFAYPLMAGRVNEATMAISVDDHVFAGQVLRRRGFDLLGEADLVPPPGD